MNFEYFVAKRLIKGKEHKSSISSTIIKIAIVAIAIGMVMMLITVATTIGLQKKIREKVAAFNGHVIVTSYDNNDSMESLVPITTKQFFYPNFDEVSGVLHIQGTATKAGVIRTEKDFEGIVLKGVASDYDWRYFKEYLQEGRLPDFSDFRNKEILISKITANRLDYRVGDKVTTFFLKKGEKTRPNIRNFTIVGIYDSGFLEFDKNFIIADIRHIRKMNKWKEDDVGAFEIFIENFDQIEEKGAEIHASVPSDLEAQTISRKYINIFEWLKLLDFNVIGIIGIIILVAGINMITALLVLILERTSMIGILKSLGSNDWSIRKVFLYNASYLIGIGLFWGNIIGIGLLLLQQKYGIMSLDPKSYYVSTAPVYIDISFILFLNVGTMLLCLLMLLIPSFVISRISPSKAIRFQ